MSGQAADCSGWCSAKLHNAADLYCESTCRKTLNRSSESLLLFSAVDNRECKALPLVNFIKEAE